ncbi:hypothetical protein [Lujinxingia vulgaris]|uniref:hypothetical protein n=1 Tax=Lujinxingia vulgaris TaxID=2600176 RepID=UPI001E621C7F|nr:hypothetical protein [Lujinxingia vulgaris]
MRATPFTTFVLATSLLPLLLLAPACGEDAPADDDPAPVQSDAGEDADAGEDSDAGDDPDAGEDTDAGDDPDAGEDTDAGENNDCTPEGAGTSSFDAPIATAVGEAISGVADSEWDYYRIEVPDPEGFWQFELVADDDDLDAAGIEIERVAGYSDEAGEDPYWDSEELGKTPEGSAIWRGAYDNKTSPGWFEPWFGDDLEPTFIRVRAAEGQSCTPYEINITFDDTYTCSSNTPGGGRSLDAVPLPDSPFYGSFYSPDVGTDDNDWYSHFVPSGTARYYVVRSLVPYRFALTNADGITLGADFGVINAPSPLTLGIAYTEEGTYDYLLRMEHIHSSSFGCVPFIIDVIDEPHP